MREESAAHGTTTYAYDGRGSAPQTLGASGTVSSWQMWGAFGEQEAGSALGELPSYGYNAEEAYPQTGLQYLRARYYDVSIGRFGVQDGYLGQTSDPLTLNRYLYCLSDLLKLIDPSGRWGFDLGSAIGRVIAQAFGPKYPQINQTISLHQRPNNYIYIDVPTGRWNISDDEALATTNAGIANWNYREAVRTGASASAISWYFWETQRRQAELKRFYCGTASYQTEWTYDRDAAIDYARMYSTPLKDSEELQEIILG